MSTESSTNLGKTRATGRSPSTTAVRAGIERDSAFGAVRPPLVL
jgi:hypothetical protein